MDEDEYNQFDELPPFENGIRVDDEQRDKTSYVRIDHHEGLVLKEISKWNENVMYVMYM